MLTLNAVPTKTVPDYNTLAAIVREHGAVYFPPGTGLNNSSVRTTLHKQGLSCYTLENGGHIVAPLATGADRGPGKGMPQHVRDLITTHFYQPTI